MTGLRTTEQANHEKKWMIDSDDRRGSGAVLADYSMTDSKVEMSVGIHVGDKSVRVPLTALGKYIEALTAAKKWLEDRGE